MTPAQRDISAYRNTVFGETYAFTISGSPVDITGYTIRMQVRDGTGAVMVDLETVGTEGVEGIFVINAMQGLFASRIEQATLAGVPAPATAPLPSVFSYDAVLYDINGYALGPVMQGNFTLYEGVTA